MDASQVLLLQTRNRHSAESKGSAFVWYATCMEAARAILSLHSRYDSFIVLYFALFSFSWGIPPHHVDPVSKWCMLRCPVLGPPAIPDAFNIHPHTTVCVRHTVVSPRGIASCNHSVCGCICRISHLGCHSCAGALHVHTAFWSMCFILFCLPSCS